MTARDPVVLAFASIATGATAGASVITLGVIVLRLTSQAQSDAGSGPFLIISLATLAGAVVAAAAAWSLTSAIPDFWKRGVISAMATMLGFMVAAATAPIDMLGGTAALIAYALVLAAAAVVSYRGAVRAAG